MVNMSMLLVGMWVVVMNFRLLVNWNRAFVTDEAAGCWWCFVVVTVLVAVVHMVVVAVTMVMVLVGMLLEVCVEVDGRPWRALLHHWNVLDVAMGIIPWFISIVTSDV